MRMQPLVRAGSARQPCCHVSNVERVRPEALRPTLSGGLPFQAFRNRKSHTNGWFRIRLDQRTELAIDLAKWMPAGDTKEHIVTFQYY